MMNSNESNARIPQTYFEDSCTEHPPSNVSCNIPQTNSNEAVDANIHYVVTGSAAHDRISPLLPPDWIDCSKSIEKNPQQIDFLWENTPRSSTRKFRDHVKCYSHLPNGLAVLDSKWALARLMRDQDEDLHYDPNRDSCNEEQPINSNDEKNPHLVTLETHCFRGASGFEAFSHRVGLSYPLEENAGEQIENKEFMENRDDNGLSEQNHPLLDLDKHDQTLLESNNASLPPTPSNLWVLKDANSNGAGGIWIVSPLNYHAFIPNHDKENTQLSNPSSLPKNGTPLIENHRYVAQKYAWPPVLYQNKKCHVRVYALMTCDGRAYVHKRAFLHVANDCFDFKSVTTKSKFAGNSGIETQTDSTSSSCKNNHSSDHSYEPTVHITNCCANSHDDERFAGEICADLEIPDHDYSRRNQNGFAKSKEHNFIISLSSFAPSIYASVQALAKSSFPFLQGGAAHSGFEYMGLDFILSYKSASSESSSSYPTLKPIAYLLEVNAPPSQDTATGLVHAEKLHDEVISDLLTLWVYPRVCGHQVRYGGWNCVYDAKKYEAIKMRTNINTIFNSSMIQPSKAVSLNKLKWAIYERKIITKKNQNDQRRDFHMNVKKLVQADKISNYARSHFPYFSRSTSANCTFFENAGGTQVPYSVIKAVTLSLSHRHRDEIGSQSKVYARQTLLTILGAGHQANNHDADGHNKSGIRRINGNNKTKQKQTIGNRTSLDPTHAIFLGANATSLLSVLAQKYIDSGLISNQDEIVIAEHNHDANVTPWLHVARMTGAKIKWWKCNFAVNTQKCNTMDCLNKVLSPSTKIIAIAHASNVLGQLLDIQRISRHVKSITSGRARIIVDGVAAVPHRFANLNETCADWYVLSCHKLFATHIGALCGRLDAIRDIQQNLKGSVEYSKDCDKWDNLYKHWESGTINYEACAGVGSGLSEYFQKLAGISSTITKDCHKCTSRGKEHSTTIINSNEESHNAFDQYQLRKHTTLLHREVMEAYQNIEIAESPLVQYFIDRLSNSDNVQILHETSNDFVMDRLPIVCFSHKQIKSRAIVQHCMEHGFICRCGYFLASRIMNACKTLTLKNDTENCNDWKSSTVIDSDGVVRFSLAHYNTMNEIRRLVHILEEMHGWY